ncbi:LysR family transcriptional regulator [Parasphingorhabdus litoris]|uniref:LysR family transcriptional regulator n=1 Tax=Parasphingorhabdus litoris TaxID=394733 RepID=A0ABN1A1I4_9SPHN|nr:LysR family transcriptional regulator [Parasphingorhabdus litoris]
MSYDLNWMDLKVFAAVAKHRSLKSAAKHGAASQPTLSRRISALEHALGVKLFERTSNGLALTEVGKILRIHADEMNRSAARLMLTASDARTTINGTVRIAASESVAVYCLPAMIADLRRAKPEIDIELVASDTSSNLLLREADIAVRMYQPTQGELIARKVGDLEIGVFASTDYLAKRKTPTSVAELMDHDIVGFDRNKEVIKGFLTENLIINREFFPFRCDNQIVNWQMVLAGYGIGFNQLQVGLVEQRVVRLLPDHKPRSLPIYLVAHSELKTSARVRWVFDFLVEAFAPYRSSLGS